MAGNAMIEVHRKVGWCDDGINNWTLIRTAGSQSIQKVSQVHDVARLNVTETDTSDGAGWRKDVPGSLSTNTYSKMRSRLKGGGTNPRYFFYVRYTDGTTSDTGWVAVGTGWVIVNLGLAANKTVYQVEIYVHSDPGQGAYLDVDYVEIIGQDPVDLLTQDPPRWTVEKAAVELLSTVGISRFDILCNNQVGGLEDEVGVGDHVKVWFADENDAYALWEKVITGRISVKRMGRRDGKEFLEIGGFDYGAYLQGRKWDKEYLEDRELSLILKDCLVDKVPEISTTGVYATSVSVKNTYKEQDVLALVKELSQMAGYEWYVDPAADIDFYQIGQATVEGGLSPLREQSQTYPTTRLRELNWEESIDDVFNKIRLYIFEGEYAPRDQDGWTEDIGGWSVTPTGPTLSADADRVRGNASLKASFYGLGTYITLKRNVDVDMYGIEKIRFYEKYSWSGSPTSPKLELIIATDDSNYYRTIYNLGAQLTWHSMEFSLANMQKVGNPSNIITYIKFHITSGDGNFGDGAVFVDWLYLANDPKYVTAEDTGSQSTYGLRERVLVEKTVRNTAYAQKLVDAYRDQFKNPLRHVTAICDGSTWFRPAQKIVVDVPSRDIDNKTFRIIRAVHIFEPGKDYRCELSLLAARGAGGVFDENVRASLPPETGQVLADIQQWAEVRAIGGAGVIAR